MDLLQQQIIASYALACTYARRCSISFPGCFDPEELTSAGIVGYIIAAHRYDETKGNSFRGFCAVRIRGAVMDELRRLTWEPRAARRMHQTVAKKRAELEMGLQRKPTHKELAEALGIGESDLAEMQRLSQPPSYVSLDDDSSASDEEDRPPLREIIADQTATDPREHADMAEIRRALCLCIGKLPRAEAMIIVLYYLRNVSFKRIAEILKLSPSRISQLHYQALASLKKHMEEKLDSSTHESRSGDEWSKVK
jgi:RNA polymerase sigma factor for flagellar operon FliA